MMTSYKEVVKISEELKRGKDSSVEKAMDDAVEFMNRKGSKQEQDRFLQQILFGIG